MKTLTEFAAPILKNALKTKQELVAAGKTPEELPAALGEALKVEGDKLTMLMNAIELVQKNPADLKRVVVLSLAEGEKAPRGLEQKGEHHFAAEYFPPMPGQGGRKEGHGKDRGGKGRDGKGRDRRGGKPRGRGPRREGGAEGVQAGAAGEKSATGEGGENNARRRRAPRGPRNDRPGQQNLAGGAPRQPAAPSAPLPMIKPRTTPSPAPAGTSDEGSSSS